MSEAGASSTGASWRKGAWLFGLALALRLWVVAYAAQRFPPADDGSFYHVVASRIAKGAGYTWAWPDGAITHAAHYPVGYPALLGAAYALLGSTPLSAMLFNAVAGALLVWGVHSVASTFSSPGRACAAALVVAFHPTLVLYTAALMTEGLAASALVLLMAYAVRARTFPRGPLARLPLSLGGALLVLTRPQLLPMLPALGAIAVLPPADFSARQGFVLRLRGACEVLVVTLALCAPWTLRNCAKMDGCVFVSANGGWNLLIGTFPEGKGSFAPIAGPTVPPECRGVFGEIEKDRCFARAGLLRIRADPWAWISIAPEKLGQLFNHGAVAGSYLASSNPGLVTDSARRWIGGLETACSRLLLLGACVGLLRATRARLARGCACVAAGFALTPWGHAAELALLGALLARCPGPGRRPLLFAAAVLLSLLVLTHVVFFGAPRYALVWLPWLAWLSVLAPESRQNPLAGRLF